tara:strand:+ start:1147 stop:1695 length:549 start_codon:yes stop_codon:yes gene_type:complete
MAFRSVRITFTNEDGNSKQITFKQEVGKPITIPVRDEPVAVKPTPQPTPSPAVQTTPEEIGNQLNQPISYLQAAVQPYNDGRFSQPIGMINSPTYDEPKLEAPKPPPPKSSGASMGAGYTQNIQVKDSSTGQMITQAVTQEMINSNPSLASFYADNGYITSNQWQMANGNTTGRFPTGRPEF